MERLSKIAQRRHSVDAGLKLTLGNFLYQRDAVTPDRR